MRRLWHDELVDFTGSYHRVPDAGLNPRPVRGTIPIWFGGHSEPVIRRIARLGDGWMPTLGSAEEAASGLRLLDACLHDAGRSRADIGLEARIPYATGDAGRWRELLAGWQEAGATHATLVATDAGLQGADEHIRALQRFSQGIQLS
jgi:alkanesulfonate monooxygenase SsuD/methylene tetrahydromethanopterin reductase-like flavin-dependent oxidoreductase (luciferase family)